MGKSIDATQETIALGMCSILASCLRSLPITSSLSRSAINHTSEVSTSLGGLVTAAIVALALAFLTDAFYYIPKASLAAVVISAILFICEYEVFSVLWRTKSKYCDCEASNSVFNIKYVQVEVFKSVIVIVSNTVAVTFSQNLVI